MANEIIALPASGVDRVQPVLFLIDIISAPTAPDINGVETIILTPSSELPQFTQTRVSAADKIRLDAGTMVFTQKSIGISDTTSNSQLVAKVQTLYMKTKTEYLNSIARAYKHAGKRLDAV